MQVQPLGQEDPLEDGMATHSSILAWRISQTKESGSHKPQGRTESDMTEATQHSKAHIFFLGSRNYVLFLLGKKKKNSNTFHCLVNRDKYEWL